MNYKFRIPIGDWSGDGHGHKEFFLIKSNKPVEAVREAYFAASEKLGYNLDGSHDAKNGPCADYEDRTIDNDWYSKLVRDGILNDNDDISINEDEESGDVENETYDVDTDMFVGMVLAYLKVGDPELVLEVIKEESLPMLPFYGYDDKQRHIGYFGYGLFD